MHVNYFQNDTTVVKFCEHCSERFYLLYCKFALVCCFAFHLTDDDYRVTDDKREGEEGVKKEEEEEEREENNDENDK